MKNFLQIARNRRKKLNFKFLNLILLFSLLLSPFSIFAQNKPDDVVGYYLNEDPFSGALSQVYIYNAGNGVYEGIVIWVREVERI